ncbi:MAG: polysaccharide deacetylase family protein [Planctomycetes bacterium]|nr:polysaccharide deacetylase family protein [Planctomycetota bacterium]MCC7171753.1 polysaccharide deacetylase family protein [Planctomycetota bacterium]
MKHRRVAIAAASTVAIAMLLAHAAWTPSCSWFGDVDTHATTSRRAVALTFDDGPDPDVTPRVLDALAALGVHATFFVIGERAQRHPELMRRIVAEGHLVANHSWDHAALPLRSSAAIRADLERTQTAIESACGVRPSWFRPPYGVRDPRVLAIARELGLRTSLWSVSPRDWQDPGTDAVVDRTLSVIEPGDIVLLHDGSAGRAGGHPDTAHSLPRLVRGLRDRGYEAIRLDEILVHR